MKARGEGGKGREKGKEGDTLELTTKQAPRALLVWKGEKNEEKEKEDQEYLLGCRQNITIKTKISSQESTQNKHKREERKGIRTTGFRSSVGWDVHNNTLTKNNAPFFFLLSSFQQGSATRAK